MVRLIAASLAMAAFAASIFAGLAADGDPIDVLARGLWAMTLFFGLGLVLGGIAELVIREHTRNRETALAAEAARAAEQQKTEAHPAADHADAPARAMASNPVSP